MKQTIIFLFFFSLNIFSAEGVKLWKGFDTSMNPEAVVNELNSMNLYKSKAKVNKIPKKPKYKIRPNTRIPVITKKRVNQRIRLLELGQGIQVGDLGLTGPYFEFDSDDRLAEVWFKLHRTPGAQFSWCSELLSDDAENGFQALITLLQTKFDVLEKDIKLGLTDTSKVTLSDGITKIWLTKEVYYKKSLETDMYKCNKYVGKVYLHYADKIRTENILNKIVDDVLDEASEAF